MNRSDILDAAKKCICEDRNKTHGSPENSFSRIAAYWSTHLNREITATDVGLMMALFKIARAEANLGHLDNFVDAIGYLGCTGELQAAPLPKDFHDDMAAFGLTQSTETPRCGARLGSCTCSRPDGHRGPHMDTDHPENFVWPLSAESPPEGLEDPIGI